MAVPQVAHTGSGAPSSDLAIATHAVVTPARNESVALRRLGAALIAQTWRPRAWIVVENGSTDDTADVVLELAAEHDWIRLLSIEAPERPIRGFASARAFNVGVASLGFDAGLITNADADISYEPDYFERLRHEFRRRPSVGIASGLCHERHGGEWEPVYVTFPKIRGASLTYRAACLAQLAPVEERQGWDGIDVVRASLRGWETATVPDLRYFHHRPTGVRDANRFDGWTNEGAVSYYMWYRPLYLLVRTMYRVVGKRDLAATGLVWGYARSFARREARHPERGFRELVHRWQAVRHMTSRFREVQGRP